MSTTYRDPQPFDRRNQARHRRSPRGPRQSHERQSITLTETGVPAATPDGPKPSPVVFVSDDSRARFPWLPARVIAGSVWRGPEFQRVCVDENGQADLWPSRRAG